ncbi:prolyl oligopeptidase family serine peptidase [Sphingomonas panacisoli]|uniref:Prolyl oligopeptidase family serine peptidase n=1 Tax=Sphingomonas panacisoli TaxID=1813879 RepID=A0A5B8LDE6_9SPHN|nr:prolyl oligopeptidase family serine peptidase [Sphingomonas panacisoli]QDZ06073.1 prolyl oligopeptidase family serine peptidase [Sphingomonas panacisoli]
MRRLLLVLAAAASVAATKAPPAPAIPPEGVQTAQPAPAGGYPYLAFVPKGYGADSTQRWPLVIFLHGSGERGTDIEVVKKNGPPKIIAQHAGSPFILVSPQLEMGADGSRWDTAKLEALLANLRKTYRVDPSRIYLTGLSLGGYGTWDWALKRPDLFAAIVPVAANSENKAADPCVLKDMPIWAFHGDQDDVVDPLQGFAIVKAVDACKGSVRPRMTVYPQMTHGSWEPAYDDPAMWRWLLEQRRVTPAPGDPETPKKKAKK